MAYALSRAPARAVSISLSALVWGGALALLAVGGHRMAQAPVPLPPEPPAITTTTYPPPPPPPPTPEISRTDAPFAISPLPMPTPLPHLLGLEAMGPDLTLPAHMPSSPPPPPLVENPRWVRLPQDLARYYPPRALQRGKTGESLLDCLVDRGGRLLCAVRSETPEGWGFGAAAVRISRDYQMVPAMQDGAPVEARYVMRVPFQLN